MITIRNPQTTDTPDKKKEGFSLQNEQFKEMINLGENLIRRGKEKLIFFVFLLFKSKNAPTYQGTINCLISFLDYSRLLILLGIFRDHLIYFKLHISLILCV